VTNTMEILCVIPTKNSTKRGTFLRTLCILHSTHMVQLFFDALFLLCPFRVAYHLIDVER